MVEFAKMHVEAALKEALDSIPCLGSSSDIATYEEVEDAVLNSYPLTNIKWYGKYSNNTLGFNNGYINSKNIK